MLLFTALMLTLASHLPVSPLCCQTADQVVEGKALGLIEERLESVTLPEFPTVAREIRHCFDDEAPTRHSNTSRSTPASVEGPTERLETSKYRLERVGALRAASRSEEDWESIWSWLR
jgi:hypothetical protein